MKKLVLGSLALAALASQTIGCTTSDPDDEFAVIRADWTLVDLSTQNGVSPVETLCPIGAPTTALINQAIDGDGRPVGPQIVDLFDCDLGVADSAPLPPDVYETFLEITTDDRTGLYATSLAEVIDVVDVDKTFSTDIVNNGGYFQVEWRLQTPQGAAVDCSQVANDGISVLSTIASGGNISADDLFDCDRGSGVTGGYPVGTYTMEITALNAQQQVIGSSGVLTEADGLIIRDRNRVTLLDNVPVILD